MSPASNITTVQQSPIETSRYQNLIILSLFIIEFSFSILSATGVLVERSNLVLKAILQFTVVMVGYLIILGNHAIFKSTFTIKKRHQPIFVALLFWTLVSMCSGVIGIYRGHDINYVIGDLYKFFILPGLFILFYYTIKSLKQVEFILNWLVIIYTVFLLLYYFLNFNRLISRVYGIPVLPVIPILPLLFYTVSMGKNGFQVLRMARYFREFHPNFVHSVSRLSLTLLLAPLIFIVAKAKRPVKAGMLLLLIFVVVSFSLAMFVKVSNVADIIKLLISTDRIAYKAYFMLQPMPISTKTEIVAGGRLSELATIMLSPPEMMILGSGLGSSLTTSPPMSEWEQWSGVTSHSLHSVFGEVLYRTGIFNLLALTYLIAIFVKKAFFYRKTHPLGILTSAFAIQLLINYIIGESLAATPLMFCLLFVGLLALEVKLKGVNLSLAKPTKAL